MIDLTNTQKAILSQGGHLLITGGPGSGKTTVAILKAAGIVEEVLRPSQSILFLSFARATVARILEAMKEENSLSVSARDRIIVDTYHAFFWGLLKTHGYLLALPRKLEALTPPNEAIALSAIRQEYPPLRKQTDAQKLERTGREKVELRRLAEQQGQVCFNLFAPYAATLIRNSSKIRRLVLEAFPVIILDEFQDTTADQWGVVKALGSGGILMALADPEQRIFEFAGAEAKRLQQYRDTFHPTEFDLASSNHRSKGTDIATFGNDILTGEFRQDRYIGVSYLAFESNQNQALAALHGQALKARKRLVDSGRRKWTLAVLVPTKKFTRLVSDAFRSPLGNMPPIAHSATIDMEGVALAAEFLAFLLQQEAGTDAQKRAVDLICAFYRGRDGEGLNKGNAKEADSIESAHAKCVTREATGKSPLSKSVYNAIRVTLESAREIKLTGDPDTDWVAVRTALEESDCPRLKDIAAELRNLRLFERGTQIRQALTSDWRENGSYPNALQITRQAFVREHFASAARPEQGVIIMNMHKAKGKQFDEVIIFEGWPKRQGGLVVANSDRIVRNNERTDDMVQARQNFRVSVTRARQQTTILTPKVDPCVLLSRKKQST